MLVLSRHASESIRIGDDIVISVQRISGNRVIIGIEAPQEVAIRRGELAFDGDSPASSKPVAKPAKTADAPSVPKANGSGLAARARAKNGRPSRPLIVPMGDRTPEWSASHVS